MPDPVILSGGGLQVRFQFVGDRFVHSIAAVNQEGNGEEQLVPLAASLEGTPEEEWPASPAIQEINQLPGENQTAMLMGQTVQGYWSVAVELDAAANQAVFDVACRVKSSPTLSSGYRTVVAPSESAGGPVQLAVGSVVVEIELQATGDVSAQDQQLAVNSDGFRLVPGVLPSEYPDTVRWRYAVRRLS